MRKALTASFGATSTPICEICRDDLCPKEIAKERTRQIIMLEEEGKEHRAMRNVVFRGIGQIVAGCCLAALFVPFAVRADFEVYFLRHGETTWNRA